MVSTRTDQFLADLQARRKGPWRLTRPFYSPAALDSFSQREMNRLHAELRAIAQTPLFQLRERLVRLLRHNQAPTPDPKPAALAFELPTGLEAAILRADIARLEASIRFEVISADPGCCQEQWFRNLTAGSAEAWLVEVAPGSSLTPLALYFFADAIRRAPHGKLFYGDCLDPANPTVGYKPDFDPLLASRWDYLGGVRVRRSGEETLQPSEIVHVPFPVEVGLVNLHLIPASPPITSNATISAIIPTKDHPELLRRCVESLRRFESTPVQIIVVDNGSTNPGCLSYLAELATTPGIQVVRSEEPFNYSRLNNIGAFSAKGQILALVNDDVEFTQPNTLARLAAYAGMPEVGAVGPMLLYPDGRIQHAGHAIGYSGISYAHHVYEGADPDEVGNDPKVSCDRQILSVTGAVLVVEKSKYCEVGGLDETLAVTCNDVDLCLKLHSQGLRNLYAGSIRATHATSQSRGREPDTWHVVESGILANRWGADLLDPFYNPNLGLASELGSPVPSRLRSPWLESVPTLD